MREPTVGNGIEELIQGWDGLGAVVRYDRGTGSWIFIALHDDRLGPPTGGTRMRVYPSPQEGLADAMRLAAGMTRKWAVTGFPAGGGKAVLAVPRPLAGGEREGLLRRYGRLVEALAGGFATGGDLGTLPEDLVVIAGETRFVHGVDRRAGTAVDSGPYTARGVFVGIRAACRRALGSGDLSGRRVLVQGVGKVGCALARLLAAAGARALVSDVDPERAAAVAREVGGEVVAPEEVFATPCDVYAPCAVGGTLDRDSIPRLACRVVAGAANNQLAEPADAERLAARGILYTPDYLINAGAAIGLTLAGRGLPQGEVEAGIDRIGEILEEVFAEAEERGESPLAAAERRVSRVLEKAGETRERAVEEVG